MAENVAPIDERDQIDTDRCPPTLLAAQTRRLSLDANG
jgi:hypothetical protein